MRLCLLTRSLVLNVIRYEWSRGFVYLSGIKFNLNTKSANILFKRSIMMDSEISHFVDVYKDIQQIPSPVNVKVLPGEQDELLAIHTIWKSQDFVKLEKNCFCKDYVLQRDNHKVLSTGIPSDATNMHLEAFSKSGKLQAILQEQKKTDTWFLEIWNRSRKVNSFDMTERDEHGKINEIDPFKCFEWSYDENFLLYTAEEKRPKTVSFFKDTPTKKETDDKILKGEQYAYKEEWGEALVGYHHSVLCVFNIKTGKAEVLPLDKIGPDVSVGQAIWGPDDKSIIFTAWNEAPFRVGIWACRNRRSQIFSIDLTSKDIECLTSDDNVCARSPRLSPDSNNLVYLENVAAGPHFKGAKLQKYNLKTKKVSTLVNIVDSAKGDEFPGIYADSLPSRCWSDDGKYVFFTTIWRSRSVIVCVDVENCKIEKLNIGEEFGSSNVHDVHRNVLIAEVSSPNIEPCLVAGFIFSKEGKLSLEWKFLDANAPIKHPDFDWSITTLQPKVPNDEYPNLDYEIIVLNPTEKKKTPLIIMPHGGPHSCYVAGFMFRVIGHVKLGYTFCLVNYRGSVGFGEDCVNSLPGNIGKQDVEDVHNAALYMKDQEGENIGDIFLFGGSHGGFLSAHLIGQYPDFYKAASLLNPVIDLSVMIGISDIAEWCWVEGGFGNDFKISSVMEPSRLKCLWEKSPIRYLENVKTPTLLLVGKKDLRVPPCQSYKYYQYLKARNAPVKLYHYEDNHQLLKTPHDGEVFMQTAVWFLKNSSARS